MPFLGTGIQACLGIDIGHSGQYPLAEVLDRKHWTGYDKDMNKADRVPGNGRGAKGFVDIERARDMHAYHYEEYMSYKEVADLYNLNSRQAAEYIIKKYQKHLEEEAKNV